MFEPIDIDEFGELEKRFGLISRRLARLELSERGKLHWWAVLERERRAEVLLLLPRPGGRLVTITKPDYPGKIYRLPTGGVDPGESVLAAASREAYEESGLTLRPTGLLGVVDWTFTYGAAGARLCLIPLSLSLLHRCSPGHRPEGTDQRLPRGSLGRTGLTG